MQRVAKVEGGEALSAGMQFLPCSNCFKVVIPPLKMLRWDGSHLLRGKRCEFGFEGALGAGCGGLGEMVWVVFDVYG